MFLFLPFGTGFLTILTATPFLPAIAATPFFLAGSAVSLKSAAAGFAAGFSAVFASVFAGSLLVTGFAGYFLVASSAGSLLVTGFAGSLLGAALDFLCGGEGVVSSFLVVTVLVGRALFGCGAWATPSLGGAWDWGCG